MTSATGIGNRVVNTLAEVSASVRDESAGP